MQALDLTTLERCSGSDVTDDLRDRADDIVWRLRWGTDWLYVYLLLEFQSSVDPKRMPGVQLPSLDDLSEVYHMLSENLETWTDQWKREGLEQG